MNKFLIFIAVLTIFSSCNLEEDKIEDAKLLKYEMENRKLKRVSEADISNEALSKGNEIVKRVEDSLKARLKGAIAKGNFSEGIRYCNLEAMPLMKKLSKQMYADIRRVSLLNRNPNNIPKNEIEKQLLEAYQYNYENELAMSSNIQVLDKTILYTKSIKVGGLCLNCHGIEGEDITKGNVALLKELYPEGKAMGYKKGELRGMWSISFDKKELIKNM